MFLFSFTFKGPRTFNTRKYQTDEVLLQYEKLKSCFINFKKIRKPESICLGTELHSMGQLSCTSVFSLFLKFIPVFLFLWINHKLLSQHQNQNSVLDFKINLKIFNQSRTAFCLIPWHENKNPIPLIFNVMFNVSWSQKQDNILLLF